MSYNLEKLFIYFSLTTAIISGPGPLPLPLLKIALNHLLFSNTYLMVIKSGFALGYFKLNVLNCILTKKIERCFGDLSAL